MSIKTKKQLPPIKKFQDLTYADSFLFGEVMLDELTSKNVLEIILGVEIKKVVIIEKEKQLDHMPDRKSIRLDIYIRDDKNTVYNIEMQMEDKKDIPKRSRYYQGLLDVKFLSSGAKNYNILNESYVIFICQFDPFGYGKYCYTFEERCLEEWMIPLGDGTRKIFLNTVGENRTQVSQELREFLAYVKNPASINLNSEKVKALDDRVNKIKADAEVRSRYMTLANWIEEERDMARELGLEEGFEEGMEKGIEKGLQEGKIESKVELLHLKYTKGYKVAEIAEILELEESFVKEIYQLFQIYPEDSDKEITARYLQQSLVE